MADGRFESGAGEALAPSRLIDAGGWSRHQKWLVAIVACALLFDGLDNQALSQALPLLVAEWDVTRGDFAMAMTLGLVGMALGTAGGGILGDRIGRKPVLVASVISFGLFTCALALAGSVGQVSLLKLLAGFGLGGAVPNAVTFISEVTPARRRSLAVIAAALCVGVGGLVGGIGAAWILPAFGWQALFLAVGVPPLLLGLVLSALLPESPVWLVGRRGGGARIALFMARSGQRLPPDQAFRRAAAGPTRTGSLAALFERDVRSDTIALWAAYWLTLFCLYALVSWLPAVFSQAGFGLSITSTALAAFNLGGISGSLAAAWAIPRFGSARPLTGMALLGTAGAGAFSALSLAPGGGVTLAMLLVVTMGISIGGLQVALYTLGIRLYDDANRATGLGWAVGFGRSGAIVSPLVASAMLALAGSTGLFLSIALAMAGCASALLIIRRHVPAN